MFMGANDSDEIAPSTEEEVDAPLRQRPVELDRTRYYATGRLTFDVAADGLPVPGGEPPAGPEPGLSDESLVCTEGKDRPQCEHYIALLRPAEGVAKGFGPMREIRRFCRCLATASELFEIDGDIAACSARSPIDRKSLSLILDFERRQKELAHDVAEKSGVLDY